MPVTAPSKATAPRVAPRVIFNGEPGTRWVNDTGVVQYQFVASLINTCGTCLQYHLAISRWWGIPIHFGCACHQVVIRRGAEAPHEFVDYRELLDEMAPDQRVKAIGGSNYRLLKEGLITWEDVVTKTRVRPLIEVVARRKLTISQMTAAGVRPDIARRAWETVHTPEAELIERHRRELIAALRPGSIAQEHLVDELGKRLARRVTIAPPPSSPPPTAPVPPTPTPAPPAGPGSKPPAPATIAPKPVAPPPPVSPLPAPKAGELAKILRETPVAPKPEPKPPKIPKFGPSKAEVVISPAARAKAKQIFGPRVTTKKLASITGAPDDARVTAGLDHHGNLSLTVEHPAFVNMRRTVLIKHGEIVIHNDIFKVRKAFRGPENGNIALRTFGRQVEQARKAGVARLETNAYRVRGMIDPETGKEEWAGYYVWPRYGYNGPLSWSSREDLQDSDLDDDLREATEIRELMATEEGRAWWQREGRATDVEFDLDPDSYSSQTLEAYLIATLNKPQ